MSTRQTELALLSLMPTHRPILPPQLIELADSLLARSWLRASTLKAKEEVARHYACANIACERLKISLDLPPIEPRPPVPRRIYKRLYTHLDNILPQHAATPRSTRIRTPSSKQRDADAALEQRPLPSRGTPTKERSLAQFRTPKKPESATPAKRKFSLETTSLPPWMQPVIRFIAAESSHRKLAPTLLAGTESILMPGGRKAKDTWVWEHLTDFLAALFFFSVQRLREITKSEDSGRKSYVPLRKIILALLRRARETVIVKDFDDQDAWVGWKDLNAKDFDAAVTHVNTTDWLSGDWFICISDVVKPDSLEAEDRDVDEDAQLTEDHVPARRADTMLQDRYDYLSSARRAEYRIWKEATLAEIDSALETIDCVDAVA